MRESFCKGMVAVALGIALVGGAALAAEDPLKVGDNAPEFELKGSDGKTYSLSSFRGEKPVVIAWFPKAFTGGCTKQCISYAKGSKLLKDLDVAYFTASVDDVETNTKFAESVGADYPILSDPDKEVARKYGVLNDRGFTDRVTFYIDKQGVIRAIDRSINTEQAAEDTAAKVKQLGLVEG